MIHSKTGRAYMDEVKLEERGGAYDMGSRDCYYGRPAKPNIHLELENDDIILTEELMDEHQINDYYMGYEDQFDTKQFKNADATIRAYEQLRDVSNIMMLNECFKTLDK